MTKESKIIGDEVTASIKPCPFCNSLGVIGWVFGRVSVYCEKCGATIRGNLLDGPNDVVRAWNTRRGI